MKPLSTLRTALLGVALATAGCDVGSGSGGVDAAGSQSPIVLRTPEPAQPLLRKLHSAPWKVAHQGVRRIEQSWQVGASTYSTIYRERVSADGQGHFALDTLELVEPQVSAMEEFIFFELQKAREGFLYRYRDFRIHDEARFARYYSVVFTGTLVQVAGRDCEEVVVQRRKDAPWTYTLSADRETGLVLRCRQTLRNGAQVGLMEFESVDFAPALSQVVWHQAANDEEQLESGSRVVQQLGFTPTLPRDDGASFALIAATRVGSPDPQGGAPLAWAKYALTDGVEIVFFLDGGPDPAATPASDDVVRQSPSVGPWTHVEGTLHGERVMALGRVSPDELLDLLDSAF